MATPPFRWNLFARELEDILQQHGYHLGHLVTRVHMHPQKVQRLKQSLQETKFHLLPPQDIEAIVLVFGLNRDEQLRLRAAILATAVEEVLMGRIVNRDAFLAAEQLLPTLYTFLSSYEGVPNGAGAIKAIFPRRHQERPMDDFVAPPYDAKLEHVLLLIDHAVIATHLAIESNDAAYRLDSVLQARMHYQRALDALERVKPQIHDSDTWQMWQGEIRQGLLLLDELAQQS